MNYISMKLFKKAQISSIQPSTHQMKTVICSHFLENDKSFTVKDGLNIILAGHRLLILSCGFINYDRHDVPEPRMK